VVVPVIMRQTKTTKIDFYMSLKQNKLTHAVLNSTPLLLFALLFIIFGLVAPKSFYYQNIENAFKQASYFGIITIGMTFVLLTGGIDLSVDPNMYVSVLVAGLAMQYYSISPWFALILCLFVGGILEAVNAFAVVKLKIMPFVVTLAIDGNGKRHRADVHQIPCRQFPRFCDFFGLCKAVRPDSVSHCGFRRRCFLRMVAAESHGTGSVDLCGGFQQEVARKADVSTDRALIINADNAIHGGAGSITEKDVVYVISEGGQSAELIRPDQKLSITMVFPHPMFR
jgi:hypothetical protein